MTSQIKDSPYFNFFVDNPDKHGLTINGKMKNDDTTFRYRKYCKSQTVDFRFPWKGTKVHFRVKDQNDLKLGLNLGSWKLGNFEAQYFAKVFSKEKALSYSFGFSRKESESLFHQLWVSMNQGLLVNYNFNVTQKDWYTRTGISWNVANKQWNFDGLFNYTKNMNDFFVKASNTLDNNFKCTDQSVVVGYLRRRGNDKACGFQVDKNLNFDLVCHGKVKNQELRFYINKQLEVSNTFRYAVNDTITVQSGVKVPLLTIGKVCPMSYLTALQVELNI